MYPVGSNGGSQSILDARTLADQLAKAGVEGLRAYEAKRRPKPPKSLQPTAQCTQPEITPQGLAAAADRYRVLTRADCS